MGKLINKNKNNTFMYINRCEIPCPRDCQVGPWSKWGPCKPSKCPSKHETEAQEG